jgi:hypothetical protein
MADDAIDCALSVDALHKAAKEGELAAQTLLVLAKGHESELAALAKRSLVTKGGQIPPDAGRQIRQMTANALSQMAFAQGAPRKMRQAARRYLESGDAPSTFPVTVSVGSFAEARKRFASLTQAEIKRVLAEDGMEATLFGWLAKRLAGGASFSCLLCEKPEAPHKVVFGESDTGTFAAGLCAACAALPEADIQRRLGAKLRRALSPARGNGLSERQPHTEAAPKSATVYGGLEYKPMALDAPSRRLRKAARRYLETGNAVIVGPGARARFLPLNGALMDMAEALARKALVGVPNGQLPPTWLLQRDDEDSVMVVETPWSDDREKFVVLDFMRGLMSENSVDAYAYLFEGWMAPESAPVRPRDSDARVEVVFAVVSDGKSKTFKVWSLLRGDDSVCSELEFLEYDQCDERFTHLLDEP